jgi:hypothetical protein
MFPLRPLFAVLTFVGFAAAGCAAATPFVPTMGSNGAALALNGNTAVTAQATSVEANAGSFLSHNGSAVEDPNAGMSRHAPSSEPKSPFPTATPTPPTPSPTPFQK